MNNNFDVIVVGGGPAGMIAAIQSANFGAKVALMEKNGSLGKKLAITGGGRCNLTSKIPIEDFFDKIPCNAKFLYKSFRKFSNEDLVEFFRIQGIKFHAEGDKIYPSTNDSKTIISALERMLTQKNVAIIHHCEMNALDGSVENGFFLRTNRGSYSAQRIILATGGYSFPSTGSDGSVQEFLSSRAIEVKKPLPSLVRIHSNAKWITESSGISLDNAVLTLFVSEKKKKSLQGQLLFTHSGVSGPVAMNLTAYFTEEKLSDVRIVADFVPELSEEEIAKILRESPSKGIENKLSRYLPKNLLKNIFADIGAVDFHNIKKGELSQLIKRLKEVSIPITGIGGIKEAIVTRGGVSIKEINPATMELRKLAGVYVAGEMIDVDAQTGGYNLQIAFSTGFLSGEMAAKSLAETLN